MKGRFYSAYFLFALCSLLAFTAKGQPCLNCYGGDADGSAMETLSDCSPPLSIFAGGIYTGFASSAAVNCIYPVPAFAMGGSFGGSSASFHGICEAPVSIVFGGDYSGTDEASIRPCSSPVTILAGGEYDGMSSAAISPCEPPLSNLTGGQGDGITAAFMYCGPVSADAGAVISFSINVYPNPASEDFSILFDSPPVPGGIVINDALGKEIASQQIEQTRSMYTFKSRNWADGAYIVKITSGGRQSSMKLMIIRNSP